MNALLLAQWLEKAAEGKAGLLPGAGVAPAAHARQDATVWIWRHRVERGQGGQAAAWRVIDSTRISISVTANLGDNKSNITHPVSPHPLAPTPKTPRAEAGISDGSSVSPSGLKTSGI